ncbi:hypothetical protein Dimus_025204 [Dionaea muscipula]
MVHFVTAAIVEGTLHFQILHANTMQKGLSIPQREAPVGGSWIEDISIENSNWAELLRYGVEYSQDMENHNGAAGHFTGLGHVSTSAGFNQAASNSMNGCMNHIAEAYSQELVGENGCWNNSWAQLLELMKAPAAVSDNEGMVAKKIFYSPNKQFITGSSSPNGINWTSPVVNIQPRASTNGMTYKSVNAEKKLAILDSGPQQQRSSVESTVSSLLLLNHTTHQASFPHRGGNNLTQTSGDGFPQTCQPLYNLNSPPWRVAETASSIMNSTQLAPATLEQARRLENFHYQAMTNVCVEQNLSQDKAQQKSLVLPAENEEAELHCPELIECLPESSSTTIGTQLQGRYDSGKGDNQEDDLNKTPPHKTSRRKKHRPKVVTEGKPRRGRKLVNKEDDDSKSEKGVKRKYIRKKIPKTTNTPEADAIKETKDTKSKLASRSCRRALNFEIVNQNRDETQGKSLYQQEGEIQKDRANLANTNFKAGLSSGFLDTSNNTLPQTNKWNEGTLGNKEATVTDHLHHTILQEHRFFPYVHTPIVKSLLRDQQREERYASTCNITQGATDGSHRANYCGVGAHDQVQAGRGQSLYHQTTQERFEKIMQEMSQELHQRMPHSNQGRGLKRVYSLTAEVEYAKSVHPTLLSQEFQVNDQSHNQSSLEERDPENYKKKRVDNRCYTTIPSVHKVARFTEDGLRQVQANNKGCHILVNQTDKGRGGLSIPSSRNSYEKTNQVLDYMINQRNQYMHSDAQRNIQRQHKSPEKSTVAEPMGDKRANMPTPYRIINPATAKADSSVQHTSPCQQRPTCINTQGIEPLYTSHSNWSTNMQEKESMPMSVPQSRGPHEKQKNLVSIDDVICRFQHLHLYPTGREISQHEQHALVLYKGNGTMVPYEAFDPIRRRKPRPKVDLDPETNRIWKLLMGKEASNDEPETDANKAKWWEEERKVFRGRADSFIARMHLVQGDRRFSRWKGSVVDSVIGVFLTQNVTDHLSSSAFMSLAARFPVQSTTNSIPSQNGVPRIIVEEPEVIILEADSYTGWLERSTSPIYSKIPHESSEDRGCSRSFINKTSTSGEAHNWGMEEVISSQDSTGSTVEVVGRVHSCSGMHPREHHIALGFDSVYNCSSTSFTQLENITRCSDFTSQVPGSSSVNRLSRNRPGEYTSVGNSMHEHQCSRNNFNSSTTVSYPFDLNMPHMQALAQSDDYQIPMTADFELSEVQSSRMFGNESIKCLSSNASAVGVAQHMGITSRSIGQGEPRNTGNGGTRQEILNGGLQAAHYQNSCRNHQDGGTMVIRTESRSDNEHFQRQIHKMQEVPKIHKHLPTYKNGRSVSVTVHKVPMENKTADTISKEQLSSLSNSYSKANPKALKTKGEKIEAEKKTVFDWDSLRKQVYSNGRKERTKDAMDSIDYEAVRCADVKEISMAIKDRGMNNMLAERIKDFLNRLVRDHESIDLEWLKEVPQDKAKDYLLSIWGLGLKSVECVRLLTLHQHAFPVDTNVGRIAVRLGWVPLQPLPESLQLHLLELYPVLESIQKYLWPRLCTLDQHTLYELHYQLITFGKVFCTKSKPNCNGCPLRGECRHFASAFASGRLALPGPEEKSMVTSTAPSQPNARPIMNVNPIQLLPLEDMPPGEAPNGARIWEPIVEEPPTPEPISIELLETDIEDAFYEDPDEIPNIKLSAEDITSLRNYLQENVDLQEGYMSKALVALNPEAVHIPAPKLKNVSRLRTEHQVYELPDTHPLLNELDRKEPDDPSPYLLAIWTPGETANSILPPEGTCGPQDSGKLCTEKTCFSCNSKRESNSQIVRGTILIPCRTAMRGSFPLNGTYFQVNEVFADHDSSLNPIDVPREFIWNLQRRTVYFGTSVSTIFKGMSTEDIQYCFWRGFVCVRGFDRTTRAPRPLMARLHFPASKVAKGKKDTKE